LPLVHEESPAAFLIGRPALPKAGLHEASVAVIAVVLVSAWVVVETDKDQRNSHVPVLLSK
jgi:hypothetical protein